MKGLLIISIDNLVNVLVECFPDRAGPITGQSKTIVIVKLANPSHFVLIVIIASS